LVPLKRGFNIYVVTLGGNIYIAVRGVHSLNGRR
jgi:hypothetical protein